MNTYLLPFMVLKTCNGHGESHKHAFPQGIGVIFIVLCIATILAIFPGSAISEKIFRLNADYAIFMDKENKPYIEIYYSFDKSTFVLVEGTEAAKQGEALLAVKIAKAETIILDDVWRMQFKADDLSTSSRIVDMVRYGIDPGQYKLSFFTIDLNDQSKRDSVVVTVEVGQIDEKILNLSDIELAVNIAQSTTERKTNFYKNTLEVTPNPGGLYGDGRPILFFYIEAYNLLGSIKGEKYLLHSWVTNLESNELAECQPYKRIKNKVVDSSVEFGTMNISKLSSGAYMLNVGIGNVNGDLMASHTKKFFIHNASTVVAEKKPPTDEIDMLNQSEFAFMKRELLDDEFEGMQYLINSEGKLFYNSLETDDAKRRFIYSFWKSRDPNPMTTFNEFRQAYLKRKEYANQKFRRMGREGWKTDRGRVYLIYGKPDDVDLFPSTSETYPHEIWTYSIEGGVEFVFIDATGYNEYVLVHSTATGEIQNLNWRQRRAQVLR